MGGPLVPNVNVEAVPLSTYRVQFGPQFRFADGERIVPYLDALGIGHLYASPYFRARPGSQHGYDVRKLMEEACDFVERQTKSIRMATNLP